MERPEFDEMRRLVRDVALALNALVEAVADLDRFRYAVAPEGRVLGHARIILQIEGMRPGG